MSAIGIELLLAGPSCRHRRGLPKGPQSIPRGAGAERGVCRLRAARGFDPAQRRARPERLYDGRTAHSCPSRPRPGRLGPTHCAARLAPGCERVGHWSRRRRARRSRISPQRAPGLMGVSIVIETEPEWW